MGNRPFFQFDSFQLYPEEKILLHDGQRVPLKPKALSVLLVLVEAGGLTVSREELIEKVWPDVFVEDGNITTNILRLRQALGDGDKSRKFIETIPKIGYRFVAVVSVNRSDAGSLHGQQNPARKDSGKVMKLAVGLSALLLCGGAVGWFKWSRPAAEPPAAVSEFAPVRLTNHIAVDECPAYSPDGKRIAFISNRGGLPAIYLMNADGSNVRKLSNDLPAYYAPQWSPDGTKIFFQASLGQANSVTYAMNADGGNVAKLPDNFGTLSPDGKKTVNVKALIAGVRGSEEIFVADADGSHEVRLTHNNTLDADPAWSPDSGRIAFTCFPDGFVEEGQNNAEVCVMNADGSNLIRLTNDSAWDNRPIWSPDGTRIAFNSSRACPSQQAIYVMNADGSNVSRLTACEATTRIGSWSPDGKRIVYESERDGNREIYSINADPSHQTNLTHHPAEDSEPVWSPDGKQIAFISNRDGQYDLFVMNADGSNQHKLVSHLLEECAPAWSPDGNRIAFTADWQGNRDVYAANADGSRIIRLTHDPRNEANPCWSPDGKKILYVFSNDEVNQIYVMNADGSGATRLSQSAENEWQHDWSPDGKQVVFTRSRNRDVQRDIWMMNADASNSHLIAAAPSSDEFLFPQFSPDGQRIAFQRRVASPLQKDVWVMNADGSGQTRLTHLGGGAPAWSPDGKRIAFHSYKRVGNSEIYVMDVASK